MPQRYSGVKALRQDHRKHMRNLDKKTDLKKTVKKFVAAVKGNDTAEASTNLKIVYKKLDKAVKTNILKKNTVSRRKSHYAKMLKTAAVKA